MRTTPRGPRWIACRRCGGWTPRTVAHRRYCSATCRRRAYLDRDGRRDARNAARRAGGQGSRGPARPPSAKQEAQRRVFVALGPRALEDDRTRAEANRQLRLLALARGPAPRRPDGRWIRADEATS